MILHRVFPMPGHPRGTPTSDAFSYFKEFTPITRIGHSIDVYKLSQDDVDRVNPLLLEHRKP